MVALWISIGALCALCCTAVGFALGRVSRGRPLPRTLEAAKEFLAEKEAREENKDPKKDASLPVEQRTEFKY